MEKNLVILIGNIGSGKTTFSKALIDAGYISVSRDQIRYAIGNGKYTFEPEYEGAVHDITMCMFYKFMALEKNLIIDETNVTAAGRENFIWSAKNRGYKVIAVEMPKYSREESVQRRLAANHGQFGTEVWEMVYNRFSGRYAAPTIEEGFDAIVSLPRDFEPTNSVVLIKGALNGEFTA